VSLAETLVVVAISSVLLVVVYKLLMSGLGRGDEMTEEHKLMVDVRALFELLSRDVSAAHVILPSEGGEEAFKTNLTLARSSSEDTVAQLTANRDNAAFPFFGKLTEATVVKTPCRRVRYLLDSTKREVRRVEEGGMLEAQGKSGASAGNDFRLLTDYAFKDPTAVSDRIIARNVLTFGLSYLEYDAKGQAKLVTKSADVRRTACVGISFKAAQTAGLYAREAGKTPSRRQPYVEMATKFWTTRRLSEIAYPEYFSSTDEDLRY
jgi:hypothetical protein